MTPEHKRSFRRDCRHAESGTAMGNILISLLLRQTVKMLPVFSGSRVGL